MICYNEYECLICLENIEIHTDEYIILECCNKQVHIHCLCNWINSSDNINKLSCPYCRQKSIMCNDIYNTLNISRNISRNIEFRNTNINNQQYLNLHNIEDTTCSFYMCIYKIYAIVFSIVILIILFH